MQLSQRPSAMLLTRRLLVTATALLAGLGLLMVYSSSITARPSHQDSRFLLRQLSYLVVGGVLAAAAARQPVALWRQAAVPAYVLALLLLAAVLVPGIGAEINGARRWFRLGPFGLQPSEFTKLALVFFLARAAETKGEKIREIWAGWLPLLVAAIVASVLVLLEPDFGTAVFLLGMAILMLFIAGVRYRHLALLVAAVVPLTGLLIFAEPYRLARLKQFVLAWSDPSSAPYQVEQSLLALGSGGWFGTGLGAGWQKLGFLPAANTDFVFAVIAEELGLVGTLTVLGLWCVFLICGVRLASRAGNWFAYLASFGLVLQIVLQAMINIGVVTASLPPKGIALPLVSYGGSSLVVTLVSVGLVLGLTRRADLYKVSSVQA